jgi:hypothetical protein
VKRRFYAVAVRDTELFLKLRIIRAPGGIYVCLRRDQPKSCGRNHPNWDPHASYHQHGEQHQKSFGKEFFVRQGLPLNAFKGAAQLFCTGLVRDHVRVSEDILKPGEFVKWLEIPVDELSQEQPTRTHISVDIVEPGLEPALIPQDAEIIRREIFDDANPWIVATLYRD